MPKIKKMFLQAMRDAQVHKYLLEKKSNKKLGEEIIIEWFKKYWIKWYRDRWVEHLSGIKCWDEFGEEDFDLANKDKQFDPNLIARIINNLKKHRDNISENLGMIIWASKESHHMKEVLSILKKIDINNKRPYCDIEKIKIFYLALEEADRHKYIKSKEAKTDLGEDSIVEWFSKYWVNFAKAHGLPPDTEPNLF